MKREWIIGVIAALFILTICHFTSAETIILKSGQEIEGEIAEQTNEYIKVDIGGVSVPFFLDEIESIDGIEISLTKPQLSIPSVDIYHKTPEDIIRQNAQAIVQIVADSSSGSTLGSGFVIREDGVIATNFHVVAGAKKIVILFRDNTLTSDVSVVGFSEAKDICLLKIKATDLPTLLLSDTANLKQGDKLASVTISQKGDYNFLTGMFLDKRDVYERILLRHTIGGGPGVSGAPVFNMEGQVVGMHSYGYEDMMNWRFAIPIDEVKKINIENKPIGLEKLNSISDKAYLFFYIAAEYFDLGNFNEAIELYKKAVTLKPDYANAYTALSVAYLKSGRLFEALDAINHAVEIEPDSAEVQNNLASAYMANLMLPEALSAAEEAIAMEPDYSRAHEAVGIIYYYMGNLSKAKAALRETISIDDNRCTSNFYLAILSRKENDDVSAWRFYNKAIASNCNIPPEIAQELNKFGF